MSLLIRNKLGGSPPAAVPIDDLGFEVVSGTDYNLLNEEAADVQSSAQTGGDLNTAILAGDIVVLSPKDGTTELSAANSIAVLKLHNDPNWGINGANLTDLDDVDLTGSPLPATGDVLQLDGSGNWINVQPTTVAGSINFGDLADINPDTGSPYRPITSFYILEGDGSGSLNVVDGTTDTSLFIPWIEDTAGAAVAGGVQTDLTLTYNASTNKIDASVDDSYLRNDGDTLDSGTLNIASGASIVVATGASISWADAPTNGNHLANKTYVDSVASGLDTKESCDLATTPATGSPQTGFGNIPGYGFSGSPATGTFTGVNVFDIDGDLSPPSVGYRILVKDQDDPKENGIYEVTVVGGSPLGSSCTLVRADDFDGVPPAEVSAGSFTFIEHGVSNAGTGWVVTGTGDLTVDTDDINWSQFSGAGTYTTGDGLGLTGTEFYLDINNLNTIAVVGADEIAFNDQTNDTTKKRTFTSLISDLGLYTSSNLTASDGVVITGGDIQLDITNLPSSTPSLSAEMVFDTGGTGIHNKATVQSFFNQANVVYNITANGILTRTADDTYASRTIVKSTTASEEGIIVTNGNGVSANPSIGIDIEGTTASASDLASTDEFLGFNGTNNRAFTGQQIADGVSAILGGLGNAYTTIQGDSGSASAGSSSATISFIGAANGGILTVATDSAPDTVTFALDLHDLAAGSGTVDLTDVLAVAEGGSPLGSTVQYTFQDVITDLNIVSGVNGTPGIVIGDGAGNYTTNTIAVNGVGNRDGLIVVNGDMTGSPYDSTITFGLDINNNATAGEDLAAADKIIAYNGSQAANHAFTGQEVADGVSTMLGLGGITVTTINGQEVLTLVDTTRSNKVLSVGDTSVTWSENKVGNNDWLQIGGAVDALSGYLVPLNATIVKVTAHTADNKGNTKPINLYIDGSLNSTIGTFNGPSGEDDFRDVTLNIDVNQDQKLRLRGGTGGNIEDTVVTIWLKWRG